MKAILFLIVVAVALFFLNRFNPTFEDHQDALSTDVTIESAALDSLHYKNFYVASTTSDDETGTMVTFGLLQTVHVVDKEWSTDHAMQQ